MDFEIRDAEATDWATIAEFNRLLAAETEDKTLDWDTLVAGVKKLLADPHRGRYWVAEHAGRIVGQTAITYEWSDWRDGWIWWIQSVYVHAEFRGEGVFGALHRHVAALAERAGDVRAIRLYVLERNVKAQAVYRKLGMGSTGYVVLETQGD